MRLQRRELRELAQPRASAQGLLDGHIPCTRGLSRLLPPGCSRGAPLCPRAAAAPRVPAACGGRAASAPGRTEPPGRSVPQPGLESVPGDVRSARPAPGSHQRLRPGKAAQEPRGLPEPLRDAPEAAGPGGSSPRLSRAPDARGGSPGYRARSRGRARGTLPLPPQPRAPSDGLPCRRCAGQPGAGRVPAEQPRAESARRGRGAALPERGAVGALSLIHI